MDSKITVLITGLGGPLAISVLKALAMSSLSLRLIGTDIHHRSVGLYMVDKAFVLPRADNQPDEYISQLSRIVRQEKVQAIFPCSESELMLLAEHIENFTGLDCFLMVNPRSVLERVMDKYLLALDLRDNGLPAPASTIPGSDDFEEFIKRFGFPLVLKARFDSGSRNLFRIETRNQLDFFCKYVQNPVIQEYLLPETQEYTVGVFVGPAGRGEGTFILHRELAAGLTYKAEVVEHDEISRVCLNIVKYYRLVGPLNLQLRLTNEGPKIFEINPRCSSSTVMRAFYGFNEPEMALRSMILEEKVTPKPLSTGIALRMWDEIYIDPLIDEKLAQDCAAEKLNFSYGVSPLSLCSKEDNNNA